LTNIQLFDNGEFVLRFTPAGDSFTVPATEVARALGFREAFDLVRSIPEGEKGSELLRTPGGDQRTWYLTEAGFYRAIGQRQPARIRNEVVRDQVARFQTWVYSEVLPSIRRTGGYSTAALDLAPPMPYTYDEVCALLSQHYGVALTVVELTRLLRAGGVLKQNGAPTAKYRHMFWFTGSAFNVHRHVVPQVAFKVFDTGRELQDFRFIQMRLEFAGVGASIGAS